MRYERVRGGPTTVRLNIHNNEPFAIIDSTDPSGSINIQKSYIETLGKIAGMRRRVSEEEDVDDNNPITAYFKQNQAFWETVSKMSDDEKWQVGLHTDEVILKEITDKAGQLAAVMLVINEETPPGLELGKEAISSLEDATNANLDTIYESFNSICNFAAKASSKTRTKDFILRHRTTISAA
jgi:hypothetical protein